MQSKAQLRRAQHIVLKTSANDDRRATVGDHTTICLTSKMASMWCRWLASNVGKVERALIVTRGFPPHQATNNDGFDDEGIGKSRDRDRISHSRLFGRWRGSKMLDCWTLPRAEPLLYGSHRDTDEYASPPWSFTEATPPLQA